MFLGPPPAFGSAIEVVVRKKTDADTGIPVVGDAPLGEGGPPTYDFVKISEKLHEIKKMLGRKGTITFRWTWQKPYLNILNIEYFSFLRNTRIDVFERY